MTRNSLSPSSSGSFRTQSYWSFISGQCDNSERFLRVHLSHRMCDQFTLHHEFRIKRGQNLNKRQTVFFTSVDPMNQEHRDPDLIDLDLLNSDAPEWLQEFRRQFFSWTIFRAYAYEMCGFRVNTVFILTSRKTEIARFARGPKLQGPRAEDALAEPYLVQKISVIWLQQITKFWVKVVNLETITDMQSWCRTWPPKGSSRIRAKQKLLTCQENTSKDPFSRCETCKNLVYSLSWRWQDKVGLQHPEENNFVIVIAYAWWNEVDV